MKKKKKKAGLGALGLALVGLMGIRGGGGTTVGGFSISREPAGTWTQETTAIFNIIGDPGKTAYMWFSNPMDSRLYPIPVSETHVNDRVTIEPNGMATISFDFSQVFAGQLIAGTWTFLSSYDPDNPLNESSNRLLIPVTLTV